MTTLIEAAKQVLEAWDTGLDKRLAMEALRTAIAEAKKQEPVAWLTGCPECGMDSGCDCDSGTSNPPAAQPAPEPIHQWRQQHSLYWYDGYPDNNDGGGPYETRILYATPPAAQRHWAGLTDEEQIALLKDSDGKTRHWLVWQVEAKLKEKNHG